MAFHLGCLRALNERGMLDKISVISSVSGGSVLAALFCSFPGDFSSFEERARVLLEEGLVRRAIKIAFTTADGWKALLAACLLLVDRLLALAARLCLAIASLALRRSINASSDRWPYSPGVRRWASRSTILRRALDTVFDGKRLADLRADRPPLIIVACELRAKAAFYFTAERLHCWRYGSADASEVSLAHAVTASASYPAALPALDEVRNFRAADEQMHTHRIILTDGGVYDNLGLAPFWPDRDPKRSMPVPAFRDLIACRAGYSLEVGKATAFMPSRLMAAFESVFARNQNIATNRLFELRRSGHFQRFAFVYLGQDDEKLLHKPQNLVSRATVADYPTNFRAMSANDIVALSSRGQQLTHAMLDENWP